VKQQTIPSGWAADSSGQVGIGSVLLPTVLAFFCKYRKIDVTIFFKLPVCSSITEHYSTSEFFFAFGMI